MGRWSPPQIVAETPQAFGSIAGPTESLASGSTWAPLVGFEDPEDGPAWPPAPSRTSALGQPALPPPVSSLAPHGGGVVSGSRPGKGHLGMWEGSLLRSPFISY